MRVLVVASEVYPLVKTGGLADVAGALPAALHQRGLEARILLPAYPGVIEAAQDRGKPISLLGPGGGPLGPAPAHLIPARMPDSGVPVWLLDCPALFDRPGGPYGDLLGYDHADNYLRFALLSRVAALVATGHAVPGWEADVVHASDWQTGLVPAYLKAGGVRRADGSAPATVFTIHNLHFQGIFGPEILPLIALPPSTFSLHGLEFNGMVSYLKAGLYYADRLTTVSPTYAWEITTPEGGRGMDGLLRQRAEAGAFTGILNGVDYDLWNPAEDEALPEPFTLETVDMGKARNKQALQRELGLSEEPGAPLFGLVSRFSDQKGIDLVAEAVPELVNAGAQVVVLGSGDRGLEHALTALLNIFPGRIAVRIGYNEDLAHRIQAASDFLLVPSRFEPCGLTQLYALRYGALPVVRRTGGLADTVHDMNEPGGGTGFLFDHADVNGLLWACRRAMAFMHDPHAVHLARQRAMRQDFGWSRIAQAYEALYSSLMSEGGH